MSSHYAKLKKLTDEQRHENDILYLRQQKVPLATIMRNHKKGYTYDQQANTHRQIKAEKLLKEPK